MQKFFPIERTPIRRFWKTAEIGLLEPSEVNPENGYRYYAIEQLEKMLFINRLKAYSFSLDEIKAILQSISWLAHRGYTFLTVPLISLVSAPLKDIPFPTAGISAPCTLWILLVIIHLSLLIMAQLLFFDYINVY